MMKKLIATVFLAAMTLVPAISHAHDLWLNSTDYRVPATREGFGESKLYIGFGHAFPVDDFYRKEKIASFTLTAPDGSLKDIEAIEGGFTAAELSFTSAGPHIAALAGKTGYYTMFMDKGTMHHATESMKGKDPKNVIVSVYFENYAKSLITVGDTRDESYKTPVGHRLEIIPLQDPRDVKVGDMFDVQVLFDGKPARLATVTGTYMGFDSGEDAAYSTGTGFNGKASIRILHWGPQLIKAKVEQSPTGEHAGNCLGEHYAATLTFAIR